MEGIIYDILKVGEVKTYSVDGKDYELYVEVVSGTSSSNAVTKLVINGEITGSLSSGQTHTLEDGLVVGVREILPTKVGTEDKVEICLGVSDYYERDMEDVSSLGIGNKISSKEFLEFVREDLKQVNKRGLVNAYGNLKRAMHQQIDKLLDHFELQKTRKVREMSFPKKFNLIKKLGFVSPSSFQNINKSRNLLEHEYLLPDKNEVIFGVDLVELYIEHTNKVMEETIKYSNKWKKHLAKLSQEEIIDYEEEEVKIEHKKSKEKKSVADLKDYPKMFIKDNQFDGLIVVGDNAPAEHVIAATDIAMGLQHLIGDDKKPNKTGKINVGAAVLSSEVESLDENIISIGNPDINPTTAKIMGAAYKESLKFDKDTALIKIYDLENDKKAIVIMGYDASLIRAAANVLSNQKDYSLSGQEILVAKG